MARRSKYEHLKPELFMWFSSGLIPFKVMAKYPNLPRSTVYDWYKEWKIQQNSGIENMFSPIPDSNSGIGEKSPEETVEVVAIEVVETPEKLAEVAEENKKPSVAEPLEKKGKPRAPSIKSLPTRQSDYWLIRTQAVMLATHENVPHYVQVQAIQSAAKLLELERDLPKHIIEQQSEQRVDDERDRIANESTSDIAKRYKEAMGQ